ncbi:MAG: hypothetical protein AVDCRST_MAG79-2703, partial [uncultured Thermoleophilia bacterium]
WPPTTPSIRTSPPSPSVADGAPSAAPRAARCFRPRPDPTSRPPSAAAGRSSSCASAFSRCAGSTGRAA